MKELGWSLTGLLVLAAIYIGAYYASVDPEAIRVDTAPRGSQVSPRYRLDHRIVASLFWPIYQADRRLPPATWARFDANVIHVDSEIIPIGADIPFVLPPVKTSTP